MNEEFKSLDDLDNRVKPALYSKLIEIKRLGFNMVSEHDIWNYLVMNNWKKRTNLELHDIISDILYADNYAINEYVMSYLRRHKKDEEDIISTNSDDLI